MKKSLDFGFLGILLLCATMAACSGGGCGGEQAEESTEDTVTCGQGTHQVGNSCVAN